MSEIMFRFFSPSKQRVFTDLLVAKCYWLQLIPKLTGFLLELVKCATHSTSEFSIQDDDHSSKDGTTFLLEQCMPKSLLLISTFCSKDYVSEDTPKTLHINFNTANTQNVPPIYSSLTMLKENDLCRSIILLIKPYPDSQPSSLLFKRHCWQKRPTLWLRALSG